MQKAYVPRDLVASQMCQKTSTIYALFSKTNTILLQTWKQEEQDYVPQTNSSGKVEWQNEELEKCRQEIREDEIQRIRVAELGAQHMVEQQY